MGRGHISDSKFELCKYSKIGRRYIDIEFGRMNIVAVAIVRINLRQSLLFLIERADQLDKRRKSVERMSKLMSLLSTHK